MKWYYFILFYFIGGKHICSHYIGPYYLINTVINVILCERVNHLDCLNTTWEGLLRPVWESIKIVHSGDERFALNFTVPKQGDRNWQLRSPKMENGVTARKVLGFAVPFLIHLCYDYTTKYVFVTGSYYMSKCSYISMPLIHGKCC